MDDKADRAGELPEISRRIRRLIGRAIYRFDLIHPGDRIAVGLSGGKDSSLLLYALACMKRWSPVKFTLQALTVDMTDGNWDTRPMAALCDMLDVPYQVVTFPVVSAIEGRNERSPCSFCANIRRGILDGTARQLGCNSVALGHHLDDTVETVLMNLFRGGRFRAYLPRLYQDRSQVWIIRPLVYLTERQVRLENERLGLTRFHLSYTCPFSSDTERARTKELVRKLEETFPSLKSNVQHALETLTEDDLWRHVCQLRRDDLGETGNQLRKKSVEGLQEGLS